MALPLVRYQRPLIVTASATKMEPREPVIAAAHLRRSEAELHVHEAHPGAQLRLALLLEDAEAGAHLSRVAGRAGRRSRSRRALRSICSTASRIPAEGARDPRLLRAPHVHRGRGRALRARARLGRRALVVRVDHRGSGGGRQTPRQSREGATPKEYTPAQADAYRMWPDPERSGEAESPMQSVLEIAEELRILTKAVRATAVSRMLNGMLKVRPRSLRSRRGRGRRRPRGEQVPRRLIDHMRARSRTPARRRLPRPSC